jgi:hypothetical protein
MHQNVRYGKDNIASDNAGIKMGGSRLEGADPGLIADMKEFVRSHA